MKNRKGNFKFFVKFLWFFLGVSVLYAAPTRIMPLGDSITYDENSLDAEQPRPISARKGYRNHLWYALENVNYDADFVGSLVAGEAVTPTFDPDNEGHPGWTSYEIADKAYEYMHRSNPDVVLLHAGTNDQSTSIYGVNSILHEIGEYEEDIGKPVRVIVALIIDREYQKDPIIEGFNNKLYNLVWDRIAKGDRLTLVNMYRGAGLTRDDYVDNTHPNDGGYAKMANVWAKALNTPYIPELYTYPFTLVDISYIDIESISVDGAAGTVDFITEIPDDGIIF